MPTGDLAYMEKAGYTHHDVFEAEVLGVPHVDLGEEVAAIVVLRPRAKTTADELRQFVKDQVVPTIQISPSGYNSG